jgi:hypothetical protein
MSTMKGDNLSFKQVRSQVTPLFSFGWDPILIQMRLSIC